jgi:hypothetical protein
LVAAALADQVSAGDNAESDAAWGNNAHGGSCGVAKDKLVELAHCVRLMSVRDEVCLGIKPDSARPHLALWLQVASAAPKEAVAAPLALAAFSAWMAGEHDVLKCCLDRGLALAPDYRLFSMLLHAHERGLTPADWERIHMTD